MTAHSPSGALPFLNPTTRYHPIRFRSSGPGSVPPLTASEGGIYHVWRSRDNRKGRHAAVVLCSPGQPRQEQRGEPDQQIPETEKASTAHWLSPRTTDTVVETCRGVAKMFTRFPFWDVSYDVAVVFTLGMYSAPTFTRVLQYVLSGRRSSGAGSVVRMRKLTRSTAIGCVVWVMNGFFVWYPLAAPWSQFPGEVDTAGGWTAFVGATIFEIGSVLLMLEAVNENREFPFPCRCHPRPPAMCWRAYVSFVIISI